MLKRIFIYCSVILIFTQCNHSITRIGYGPKKTVAGNCPIIITRNISNYDTLVKVGEIKLGDSGFSVSCSEEQAIEILKKEGCSLNANIVLITDEKRSDLLSSCYRCEAIFYKLGNGNAVMNNDPTYKSESIKERVKEDRSRNTVIAVFAVVLGAILGVLVAKSF
jgi:hypothetical protein